MGLLNKFTKISGQDPLTRLIDQTSSQLERRLENSVSDLFSEGLKNSNFSTGVANQLASRFGDSFAAGAADRYFRTASTAIARVAGDELFGGMFPKYARTDVTAKARMKDNADELNLSGVESDSALQFPSHLGKYYLALKFRNYTRTAPQAPAKQTFKNAIVLPIPRDLVDNTGLSISAKAAGIWGLGADVAQSFLADGSDQTLGKMFDEQTGAALLMGAQFLTGGGTGFETLAQVLGAVPNPHMSAFFQGVDLREYTFEWILAPRNPAESHTIQKIARQLKKNSLPTFSTQGQAALTYPDLCVPELHPWAGYGKDGELIKFKPALIKNVNVNYAPNGIPSFFAGTELPTFIKLSIEFIETEYFTGEDYDADRRSDGLDKLRDVYDEVVGMFSGDGTAPTGTSESGDVETTSATEAPQYSNQGDKEAARNAVANIEPGKATLVKTYTKDGNALQTFVGKAAIDGNVTVGERVVPIKAGQYYIETKAANSPNNVLTNKAFDSPDDVVNGLEAMGAVR